MNQPHPAQITPSWYGDSVGYYENDTLVIDTEGVRVGPFAMVDMYGTPHTDALHVVERYRLRSAHDRIDGVGSAINDRLKPHLVRSTFDCCRADAIEGSQRLWATGPMQRRTPALPVQPGGEIPRSTSLKTLYCN
jgi:hypothetical protein